MKSFDGYLKQKLGDGYVLLAGGDTKSLGSFLGSILYDSTSKKMQYKTVNASNWSDLITFGSNAFNSDSYSLSTHDHDSNYVIRKYYSASLNDTATQYWIRDIALDYPCSVVYNNAGTEWTYWVGLNTSNKCYGHIIRCSYSNSGTLQFMYKAGGTADNTTNWSGWINVAHSNNSSLSTSGTTATIKILGSSADVSLTSHNHNSSYVTAVGNGSGDYINNLYYTLNGSNNYFTVNYATNATLLNYTSSVTTLSALDNDRHQANVLKCYIWNGSNASDSFGTSYPGAGNGIILDGGWSNASYGFLLAIDDDPNWFMALRQRGNGTWAAWKRIPMGDGTGASGTWAISINGNAATATDAGTLSGTAKEDLFTALTTNTTNAISTTIGGTTKNITVNDLSNSLNLERFVDKLITSIPNGTGWYRIAETSANLRGSWGYFNIFDIGTALPCSRTIHASLTINRPGLVQLNGSLWSNTISKARIVHASASNWYSSKKAYFEIYTTQGNVSLYSHFSGYGWTCYATAVAVSETIDNDELTVLVLTNNGMAAPTFSGNATSASKWQTSRTLTIGNTGKSVDGSENVSWTLAEIGAAASGHDHNSSYVSGVTISGNYLRVTKNGTNTDLTIPYSTSSSTATTATTLLTNNTSLNVDDCYLGAPGLHFYRKNSAASNMVSGSANPVSNSGGDGWVLQWSWGNGSVGQQLYLDDNPSGIMAIRGYNPANSSNNTPASFTNWMYILNSANWSSYITVGNGTLNLQASGVTKTTFKANATGDSTFNIATGSSNGTISVGGTDVAVKGLGSNAYDSTSYLPLAGGTINSGAVIYLPNNAAIKQNLGNTSNYTAPIYWLKNGTGWYKSDGTTLYNYQPQIGQHNTGDSGTGAITILPYPTDTAPWEGSVGLYIGESSLKYKGNKVWHAANDGSDSGLDADLLDGTHKSDLLTAASLGASGNNVTLSVTVGGTTINTGSVTAPYATKSSLSYILLKQSNLTTMDAVDTFHDTGILWAQVSSITDPPGNYINKNDGFIISFPWAGNNYGLLFYMDDSGYTLMHRYCSLILTSAQGVTPVTYGRTWRDWVTILDTANSSVSKSDETLTVKIGNTSLSLTNTWRGIQNNLTSTSTTDSLSAAQGKALNDKFGDYLPLIGGTLTGQTIIIGTSSGTSAEIKPELDALIIAPKQRRADTSIGSTIYYPGIAFNHMWLYSNATYNNNTQAWIGLKLYDTPGSERSYLVFATKPGTGTTVTGNDRPIERMNIAPDGTVNIIGNCNALKFIKSGSSSSKVLLGDGSDKNVSDFFEVFKASGTNHAKGLVPDPGATSGTTKYLREDATWQVPPNDNDKTKLVSNGDNSNRPILLKYGDTSATTDVTNLVYYTTSAYINTNNGNITAPKFIKNGSTSSKVLLGDGSDKALNNLLICGTTSAVTGANSMTALDITKTFIHATINANATLGVSANMTQGQVLTVLVENTGSSAITITIPAKPTTPATNAPNWYSLDGHSLVIPSGKFYEISILCFKVVTSGSNVAPYYLISGKSQ